MSIPRLFQVSGFSVYIILNRYFVVPQSYSQMNFSDAITPSPTLQSGDARDFVAPTIVAGEDLGNQVELAATECEFRQFLLSRVPNAVTPDELQRTRSRVVAVETTHAQFTHGVGDIGAIQNLRNQMAANHGVLLGGLTAVEAQGQNILGRLDAVEDRLTAMADRLLTALEAQGQSILASMNGLSKALLISIDEGLTSNRIHTVASVQNVRAREQNRHNVWTPLVVERPGFYEMDVVPPIHPLSHEALLQMDDEQLNELESQFNLPVGHFAGGAISPIVTMQC
jgi:hypothetical protein